MDDTILHYITIMFLQLPSDIQYMVFDKLNAEDRVKLNIALPKRCKIRKTSHIDESTNRKLGIMAKFLKKRKPAQMTDKLRKFLRSHHDDSTIKELMFHEESMEYSLEECLEDALKRCDIEAIKRLPKDALNEKQAELSRVILDMLVSYGTVEFFEELYACDNIEGVVKYMISVRCLVFSAVNHLREDFIKHLKGDDRFSDDWELMRTLARVSIFNTANCVKILITYFDLSEDVKEGMIDNFVKDVNVDCLEMINH